jgi:hypothetical protein
VSCCSSHFSAFIILGKLAFNFAMAPHCRALGFCVTSCEILVVHGTGPGCWNLCCSPFHHSSIPIYYPPPRCAIASIRQHIITFFVFKLRVPWVTWYFAGYKVATVAQIENQLYLKRLLPIPSISFLVHSQLTCYLTLYDVCSWESVIK